MYRRFGGRVGLTPFTAIFLLNFLSFFVIIIIKFFRYYFVINFPVENFFSRKYVKIFFFFNLVDI